MRKAKIRARTTAGIQTREANKERRISCSFASEEPCMNWGIPEYLLCSEENVNLQRYQSGLCPVLFNHYRDRVIGKLDNVKFENGRGTADIVFDDDEFSDSVYKKVLSGSLQGISVGYQRNTVTYVKPTQEYKGFKGECEVVDKWNLLEVSVVSIPADPSVGIGRDLDYDFEGNEEREEVREMGPKDKEKDEVKTPAPEKAPEKREEKPIEKREEPKIDTKAIEEAAREAAQKAERERVSTILSVCRQFNIDDEAQKRFIDGNVTVEKVREEVLDILGKREKPVDVKVKSGEGDNIRELCVKALSQRFGVETSEEREVLAMSRMSLRDMAKEVVYETAPNTTEQRAIRFDTPEGVFERALGSSTFAGIMDEFSHKTMGKAYKEQEPSFMPLVSKGINTDFKPNVKYTIGLDSEPVKMAGESDEFTFTDIGDSKVQTNISTYGKGIRFTREAFINDQLGELVKAIQQQGRGYRRLQDKMFFKLLSLTSTYSAKHGNLATKLGVNEAAWSEMKRMMMMQKSFDGKGFVGLPPKFIVAPTALEATISKLLKSTSDPTAPNSGAANIYHNGFTLVTSPYLDLESETAYYMEADPNQMDIIEFTTLNGVDTPTSRVIIPQNHLGVEYQSYMDFGFNLLSYQGLVKNAGE